MALPRQETVTAPNSLRQRIQERANTELIEAMANKEDSLRRELGLVSNRDEAASASSEGAKLFHELTVGPSSFVPHASLPSDGGFQGAAERIARREAVALRAERLASGEKLANPDWEANSVHAETNPH